MRTVQTQIKQLTRELAAKNRVHRNSGLRPLFFFANFAPLRDQLSFLGKMKNSILLSISGREAIEDSLRQKQGDIVRYPLFAFF